MSVATVEGLDSRRERRLKSVWQRPSDWPSLPAVNPGDQKFVGLHAVFDHDANYCAFAAQGAFTVDWGDGSAPENFASNTQAEHNYSFSAPGLGPVTSEGFKTAVVVVTATSFVSLQLSRRHSGGGTNVYCTGWLDIRMASPVFAALSLGGVSPVVHRLLRQFEFVGTASVSFSNGTALFQNCSSLVSVVGTAWTAAITNFTQMFQGCTALEIIPLLDTSKGTGWTSMFSGCVRLKTIPPLNTALAATFATIFNACTSLKTIPLLNTSNCLSFSQAFNGCTRLVSVPLLDTSKATNFSSMFNNCKQLRSVPPLDTSKGTGFTSMFSGCESLRTIPLFDPRLATSIDAMFNGCICLEKIPALDFSTVGTAYSNLFNACQNIARMDARGMKLSFSIATNRLSAVELNRIYTNLASGVTAQTIIVTGNYGTTADDPSIATAKGWTVTG